MNNHRTEFSRFGLFRPSIQSKVKSGTLETALLLPRKWFLFLLGLLVSMTLFVGIGWGTALSDSADATFSIGVGGSETFQVVPDGGTSDQQVGQTSPLAWDRTDWVGGSPPDVVITAGQPATAIPTARATGGTTPYAYSFSPLLPNGLSLNSSDGTISGTATAAFAERAITLTATSGLESIMTTFNIRYNHPPELLRFMENQVFQTDGDYSEYQVDLARFFFDADGDDLTYAISVSSGGNSLGIARDTEFPSVFALTATATAGTAVIEVSATDPDMQSQSMSVTVEVEESVAPVYVGAFPEQMPNVDPMMDPSRGADLNDISQQWWRIDTAFTDVNTDEELTFTVAADNLQGPQPVLVEVDDPIPMVRFYPCATDSACLVDADVTATITATDSAGIETSFDIDYSVTPFVSGSPVNTDNTPVLLREIPDLNLVVGETFDLRVIDYFDDYDVNLVTDMNGTKPALGVAVTGLGTVASQSIADLASVPAANQLVENTVTLTALTVGTTTATITVTDFSMATNTDTFTITVTDPLRFERDLEENLLVEVGDPGNLPLPNATGGTGPYTYTIEETSLPAGITYTANETANPPTRELGGSFTTPTYGITEFTYTATDANSASVSHTFRVVVINPEPLSWNETTFGGISVDSFDEIGVVSINNWTVLDLPLAQATGGTPPYAYSAISDLPFGLDIAETTGNLFGTAQESYSGTSFQIQVTDSSTPPAKATLVIPFSVNSSPTIEERIPEDLDVIMGIDKVFDLSDHFSDADDDDMTFDITVTSGASLTVTKADPIFTLVPVAVGETDLTITAKDIKGGTTTYDVTATVGMGSPPVYMGNARFSDFRRISLPNPASDSNIESLYIPFDGMFIDPDPGDTITITAEVADNLLRFRNPGDTNNAADPLWSIPLYSYVEDTQYSLCQRPHQRSNPCDEVPITDDPSLEVSRDGVRFCTVANPCVNGAFDIIVSAIDAAGNRHTFPEPVFVSSSPSVTESFDPSRSNYGRFPISIENATNTGAYNSDPEARFPMDNPLVVGLGETEIVDVDDFYFYFGTPEPAVVINPDSAELEHLPDPRSVAPAVQGRTKPVGRLSPPQDRILTIAKGEQSPGNDDRSELYITGNQEGERMVLVPLSGISYSAFLWVKVRNIVSFGTTISEQTFSIDGSNYLVLPEANGGSDQGIAYAVEGLPSGLVFDPITRTVTGSTLVAHNEWRTFTYKATDNKFDDNFDEITVRYQLTAPRPVSVVAASNAPTLIERDKPVSPFLPGITVAGQSPYTYSVSPKLPAGLNLNQNTGEITGTPTESRSTQTYTLSVTDSSSQSTTFDFDLQVNSAPKVVPINRQDNLTLVQDREITIDYSNHFADPEFDNFTYTIETAETTDLVTLSNDGDQWTFETIEDDTGTVTINMIATDTVNNLSTTHSFDLTVGENNVPETTEILFDVWSGSGSDADYTIVANADNTTDEQTPGTFMFRLPARAIYQDADFGDTITITKEDTITSTNPGVSDISTRDVDAAISDDERFILFCPTTVSVNDRCVNGINFGVWVRAEDETIFSEDETGKKMNAVTTRFNIVLDASSDGRPTLMHRIPDVNIEVGQSIDIDIAEYIAVLEIPEGDSPVTYSVTTANDDLVTTQLEGTDLTLTAEHELGDVDVTVTAVESDTTVSDTFSVSVVDAGRPFSIPTNVTMAPGDEQDRDIDRAFTVSWDRSPDPSINGYKVEFAEQVADPEWINAPRSPVGPTTSSLSFRHTSLEQDKEYIARVRARASIDTHFVEGATSVMVGEPITASMGNDVTIEEGQSGTIEVRLNNPRSVPVQITVVPTDGTAAQNTHYTIAQPTTIIAAGSLTGQITINTVDDTEQRPDRQFTIAVSAVTEEVAMDTTSATVTIADNDNLGPEVSEVTASAGDAAGIDTDTVLRVTWTAPTSGPTVTGYRVQYASAATDTDLDLVSETAWSSTGITIAGTSATLRSASLDPAMFYKFRVAALAASTRENWVEQDGTVSPVAITASFASTSVSVGESDGSASLIVILSGERTRSTSLTVTVSTGTGQFRAESAVDYGEPSSGGQTGTDGVVAVTFPPNDTSQNVTIPIIDDLDNTVVEGNENFAVVLSGTDATISTTTNQAMVTIEDDDTSVATISSTVESTVEEGDTIDFTVTLTNPIDAALNFSVAVTGQVSSNDWTLADDSVIFGTGVLTDTGSLTVVIDDDQETEEDLTISLTDPILSPTLTGRPNAVTFDTNSTIETTIAADYVVSLGVDDASIAKLEDATVPVTITLNRESSQALTVDLAVTSDTAEAGDYELDGASQSMTTVTIPANTPSISVDLTIVSDDIVEGNEMLTLTLSNPSTGLYLDDTPSVAITIEDTDVATISVSTPNDTVAEDTDDDSQNTVVFSVSMDKEVDVSVSVSWQIPATTGNTENGWSIADYTFVGSRPIIFPANDNSTQTITITIVDDEIEEDAESLVLRLMSATLANPLTGRTSPVPVVVSTVMDERQASVRVSESDQTGSSNQPVSVMVSLGNADDQDQDRSLTVTWEAPEDTAGITDYVVRYRLINTEEWSADRSVGSSSNLEYTFTPMTSPQPPALPVLALIPGSEYEVAVEAVGPSVTLARTSSNSVVMADRITARLAGMDQSVEEGETADITVELTGARSVAVTVGLMGTPGTATSDDFNVPANVVIPAGATNATVSVTTTGDTTPERSESFTVALTTVESGDVGVDTTTTRTVTIQNDDGPLPAPANTEPTMVELSTGDGQDPVRDTDRSIHLDWEDPTESASVEGYKVRYRPITSTPSDWIVVADPLTPTEPTVLTNTEHTITGLMADTLYEAQVSSVITETVDNWTAATPTQITTGMAITARLSETELTIDEGGSDTSVNVELSGLRTENVTVPITSTDGTATAGEYTVDAMVQIPAGQSSVSLSIGAVDDTDDESDETFTISLGTTGLVGISDVDSTALTVTVTDNDLTAPPVPTVVLGEGSGFDTDRAATLTWEPSTSTKTVSRYEVRRGETGSSTWGDTVEKLESDRTHTFTDLDAEQEYSFQVRAVSNDIESDWVEAAATVATESAITASFMPTSLTIVEGESSDVEIVLNRARSVDVVIALTTADGTTDEDDYEVPESVTIMAETLTTTVSIATTDDLDDESDETFTVNLDTSGTTGRLAVDPTALTVSITDNDLAPPDSVTAAVGDSNGYDPDQKVTVTWAVPTVSAGDSYNIRYREAGEDEWEAPVNRTELSYTIVDLEPNTDYEVAVQVTGGGQQSDWVDATITTSAPIEASIMGTHFSVREEGSTDLTVELTGPRATAVTVGISTTVGTTDPAEAGDFNVPTSITFNPGETTATITVMGVDDADDANENLTLALVSPAETANVEVDTSSVSILITDNDATTAGPAGSEPNNIQLAVGDAQGYDRDRTVSVSWSAPTTPTGISEYQVRHRPVETPLAEWEAATTIMLSQLSHEITGLTASKEYQVQVRSVLAGTSDNWVDAPTITTDAAITARFTETTLTVTEGETAELTIELSGVRSEAVSVGITDTPGTAMTADYTVTPTVNFGVGENRSTIQVGTGENSNDEADKNFQVGLSSTGIVGGIAVDSTPVTVTITDDDIPGPETVTPTSGDSNGYNPDNTITVTWTAPANTTEITGWEVQHQVVGSVAWETSETKLANELEHTYTGLDPDTNYQFQVRSVGSNLASEWKFSNLRTQMGVTASLSTNTLSISEGETDSSVTVELSGPRSTAISIPLTVTPPGDPSTYTVTPTSADFAIGATSVTVEIATIEDTEDEEDETFTISLDGTSVTEVIVESTTLTVTITDDDLPRPTAVMVTLGNGDDRDQDRSATVTWTAPTNIEDFDQYQVRHRVVVPVGSPESVWSDPVAIPKDQAVLSQIFTDLTHSTEYQFQVRSFSMNGTGNGWVDASTTITTTPAITVSLSAATTEIDEGASGSATVSLSGARSVAVSVGIVSTPLTSTDFSFMPTLVSFAAGETEQTINITTTPNTDFEDDKTFSLSFDAGSVTGGVEVSPATVVFTIVEDEDPPLPDPNPTSSAPGDEQGDNTSNSVTVEWTAPSDADDISGYQVRQREQGETEWEPAIDPGPGMFSYTFSGLSPETTYEFQVRSVGQGQTGQDDLFGRWVVLSSETTTEAPTMVEPETETAEFSTATLSIAEGESGTVTIDISAVTTDDVEIQVATADGTATSDDYTEIVMQTITITAGETTHTLTITTTEDTAVEPDETFTITLTAVSDNITVGTVSVVTVTITNDDTTTGGGVPLPPPGPGVGGGGAPPTVTAPPPDTAAPTSSFTDSVGTTHETNIGLLADMGITRGCNPPENTRFCPDRAVTRGEMATFMVRAFTLPASGTNLFGDDDGNTHEQNINALAAAEITRGCNPPENSRYCPNRAVTRAQMGTFLARALQLPEGSGGFTDTTESVHRNDINRIAAVGITRGCNPPTNTRYCPDRAVTRGEMATFMVRAVDLTTTG